jgi:hypothetical protein
MHTRIQAKELAAPDQTLLVLLAQTGDRTALEQLLRDAYAPLHRYTGCILTLHPSKDGVRYLLVAIATAKQISTLNTPRYRMVSAGIAKRRHHGGSRDEQNTERQQPGIY